MDPEQYQRLARRLMTAEQLELQLSAWSAQWWKYQTTEAAGWRLEFFEKQILETLGEADKDLESWYDDDETL